MPELDEFFNKESKQIHSTLEALDGIRPCSKCDEDVDGGLWDPENLIMTWKCSNGHQNEYRIN